MGFDGIRIVLPIGWEKEHPALLPIEVVAPVGFPPMVSLRRGPRQLPGRFGDLQKDSAYLLECLEIAPPLDTPHLGAFVTVRIEAEITDFHS